MELLEISGPAGWVVIPVEQWPQYAAKGYRRGGAPRAPPEPEIELLPEDGEDFEE